MDVLASSTFYVNHNLERILRFCLFMEIICGWISAEHHFPVRRLTLDLFCLFTHMMSEEMDRRSEREKDPEKEGEAKSESDSETGK